MSKHVPNAIWETVDWSLDDHVLGPMLGVTEHAVKRQRRIRAPGTRKRNRCTWRIDWDAQDWALDDVALACRIGCLVETVRRQRKLRSRA